MPQLEDLVPGARVRGLFVPGVAVVEKVTWSGRNALNVLYSTPQGMVGQRLVYRHDEPLIDCVLDEAPWAFDADGDDLKLASEAYRISLAHLFDPVLAVHTSAIEPLPHQITAVYEEMLKRQPLRYLLADDPGAGKTIMAGLLIRELMARGDLRRCLIVVPGGLATQWLDELASKFQLEFEIFGNHLIDEAGRANPFLAHDLLIARLDHLSRREDLHPRLRQADWDLIIVDEAHKLSASFFGNELKQTKRYRLGELLGSRTRHLLLMTATPHNGKEEDFQLFLRLLDPDRFEGRFRGGAQRVDVADLMRRMIKEKLLRFDGTPLFPERTAATVNYTLSAEEAELYEQVTRYVQEEFNRAEKLDSDKRRSNVGFALTVLQRRLASSPEAIYQSIRRRIDRLEKRLKEAERAQDLVVAAEGLDLDEDELNDFEEEYGFEESSPEFEFIDSATAARTIAELQAEIVRLHALEDLARHVRASGQDRKWQELRQLVADNAQLTSGDHKLVIFTEHRDTLTYLETRLKTLLGRPEAVVSMHGGQSRPHREQTVADFTHKAEIAILVATDAAGEGLNLHRAHLMVNYDLPWNPNRLEQRFGRIHRIGQTRVCHLWNLVAAETREGHVYQRLLGKLEMARGALDGQVFDVLGKLFQDTSLRALLIEAVRYGDRPDVRARLDQAVDNALDRDRVRRLLDQASLSETVMDTTRIALIREDMERANARRLQPHYIRAFFLKAFHELGGALHERESGRYKVTRVPAAIRTHARDYALGPVPDAYDRICFDKALIHLPNEPDAAFVAPGHPLLDAVVALTRERLGGVLQRGAVLVDESDRLDQPRVLVYLDQTIQDGALRPSGEPNVISREVHFVELDEQGTLLEGGGAPYLDYRPATEAEQAWASAYLAHAPWLAAARLHDAAEAYAVATLIPRQLGEVRDRQLKHIAKTRAAVQERLDREIGYWDLRALQLAEDERAGKPNARLNSAQCRKRSEDLLQRKADRLAQLDRESLIGAAPPRVVGAALIVPAALLASAAGETPSAAFSADAAARRAIEQAAMSAVLAAERALGHHPRDVSALNVGYDIESADGVTGRLRFIEVKGRHAAAPTVTVTRNEILAGRNSPEQFILALVRVEDGQAHPPRYVRTPFGSDPDFGVASVNYSLNDLLARSEEPK